MDLAIGSFSKSSLLPANVYKENETLRLENAYYKGLINAAGFDLEIVNREFSNLMKIKEELDQNLNSDDFSVKESALKKLSDATAEAVEIVIGTKQNSPEFKNYEEELKDEFDTAWDKLDRKSQRSLIAARMFYQYMNTQDGKIVDYSAICLLVAKALEIEVSKRYFKEYATYLETNNKEFKKWPIGMKYEPYPGANYEKIDLEHYTLASVIRTVGYKNHAKEPSEGIIKAQLQKYFIDDFDLFKEFYQRELYKNCDLAEEKIKKDCEFVETVRMTWRNIAAHKGTISRKKAKSCLDYAIIRDRMFSLMLKDMEK